VELGCCGIRAADDQLQLPSPSHAVPTAQAVPAGPFALSTQTVVVSRGLLFSVGEGVGRQGAVGLVNKTIGHYAPAFFKRYIDDVPRMDVARAAAHLFTRC
jgi:hypothetical protein